MFLEVKLITLPTLDPNKTDDDAFFSRNGWPTKRVKPYFQSGPLSKILTIAKSPTRRKNAQNLRRTFLFILSAIYLKLTMTIYKKLQKDVYMEHGIQEWTK